MLTALPASALRSEECEASKFSFLTTTASAFSAAPRTREDDTERIKFFGCKKRNGRKKTEIRKIKEIENRLEEKKMIEREVGEIDGVGALAEITKNREAIKWERALTKTMGDIN